MSSRTRHRTVTAAELAERLGGTRMQKGWLARCPCPEHRDSKPSFSISEADDGSGKALAYCHAGCSQGDVLAALRGMGLRLSNGHCDTWTKVPKRGQARLHPMRDVPAPKAGQTHYVYRDAQGHPVLVHIRKEPPGEEKKFGPLWHDGGGWRWHWDGITRPLYHLPELSAPELAHLPVLLVEGEKTAEAAELMIPSGWAITTWPGGAKADDYVDWSPLAGRCVTIWPDADEAGKKAALAIAAKLAALQAEVRVVELPPELPTGWDLADPLPVGWSRDTVAERIAAATVPPPPAPQASQPPALPTPGPVSRCPETERLPARPLDAPAGKPEIDFDRLSTLDRVKVYQTLVDRWLPQLTGSEFAILIVITRRSLGFGRLACAFTAGRLAEHAGLTERSVGTALAKLTQRGLLTQLGTRGRDTRWAPVVSNLFAAAPTPEISTEVAAQRSEKTSELEGAISSEAKEEPGPKKHEPETGTAGAEPGPEPDLPPGVAAPMPRRQPELARITSKPKPAAKERLSARAVEGLFVQYGDFAVWDERTWGIAKDLAQALANQGLAQQWAYELLRRVLSRWPDYRRQFGRWMQHREPPPELPSLPFVRRFVAEFVALDRMGVEYLQALGLDQHGEFVPPPLAELGPDTWTDEDYHRLPLGQPDRRHRLPEITPVRRPRQTVSPLHTLPAAPRRGPIFPRANPVRSWPMIEAEAAEGG